MNGSLPSLKPSRPYFSSGPCVKPLGWTAGGLENALTSRSHRSASGIQRFQQVLTLMREVLEIPSSHQIALVNGSATGAIEMLLWNLLGSRGVDCLVWDVFGHRWAQDIETQLKVKDCRRLSKNQDLYTVDDKRDLVFTWNASTSGRCIPSDHRFSASRTGLTLCDATSAAFAIPLPWEDLDGTAFLWQKGLGGEAGVGVIVLGPRALDRLENHRPTWPIPHLFKLNYKGLFDGLTLNTLSLLLVEDAHYALKWAQAQGAGSGLRARTQNNFKAIQHWVDRTPWIEFLESEETFRSPTTVCLKFSRELENSFIDTFCTLLQEQQVAFDIKNHKLAPPSIRLWAGPTVEQADLKALFPWLEWAYHTLSS